MAVLEKLGGLASVALFWAAGWGIGELLPAIRRQRPGVRQAYRYLLGIAWVAGALYALSHFVGVPLRRPAILALGLLPLAAGALARRSRERGRPARAPGGDAETALRSRLLPRVALALACAVTLAIVGEVVTQPLRDWDGRMTWAVKARYLRAAGTVDAPVLRGGEWFVSHTHYPVLLPVAQVAALELVAAGGDDPAYRPLYAFFFPAFLALVWGSCRRWGGERVAWLGVLTASLPPLLAFFPGGGANSAYSDLPLACFYGGALLLLLEPALDLSSGFASGLLLAAAVLTKDEGAPLAVSVLLLAMGTQLWRGRRVRRALSPWRAALRPGGWRASRPIWIAAGCALAAAVLLAAWRAGIPLRYHDDYRALLARQSWGGALARIPELLLKIRIEMIALDHWGILWSVAPIVLLAGRGGLRRGATPALALAFLAPLALCFGALLITDIPNDLPRMTWNRFLIQGAIPFFTLFAWALGDLIRRTPRLPRIVGGGGRRGP